MTTDQQQPQAWYCSHQEHSTGECGPMCECTVRISNGTYGQPSDWRQQQPQAGEIEEDDRDYEAEHKEHVWQGNIPPDLVGTDEPAVAAWRAWKPDWWMDAGYEYDCFMAGWAARDATVARQAKQIERLKADLSVYANRENWFHATHVPEHGWPTKVWAWDDSREPWTMAQKALAALEPGRPDTQRYHTGEPTPGSTEVRSALCWGDGHAVCINPDCQCPCGHPAQPAAEAQGGEAGR